MTAPACADERRCGGPTPPDRRRLGDVLVDAGVITEAELAAALDAQRDRDRAPAAGSARCWSTSGWSPSGRSPRRWPTSCGLEVVDLDRRGRLAGGRRGCSRAASRAALGDAGPARTADRLTARRGDPTDVVALDDVRLHTGATELVVVVATESQIRDQLTRAWSLAEDAADVATFFEETAARDDEDDGAVAEPTTAPDRPAGQHGPRRRRPDAAPATSTSSRSATACGSATGSTACSARS